MLSFLTFWAIWPKASLQAKWSPTYQGWVLGSSTAPSLWNWTPGTWHCSLPRPACWVPLPDPAHCAWGSAWVWKFGSRGTVPPLPHYQSSEPMGSPVGWMTQCCRTFTLEKGAGITHVHFCCILLLICKIE